MSTARTCIATGIALSAALLGRANADPSHAPALRTSLSCLSSRSHVMDGIAAAAARPVLAGEVTFGLGSVLVHYATSGADAPPMSDANTDGVPDFVEEVATTADEAVARFAAMGFRRPVDDGALGGDGRIDFYLRNLQGADGNASTDACEATCSAFATVENDYAGYNYSSRTEAIRSVVPHELFHLVQYAYATEHVPQWAEGTAVWAVERLYADGNSDFERFLPAFLSKTFRPFERVASGFGDGYPYGAALWAIYLEARFGVELIVDAWERCASEPWLRALDGALGARGSSLDGAWLEFTRWNSATGDYVVDGGYANAGAWPEAPREPVFTGSDATIYIEGRSARYVPVSVDQPFELAVSSTVDISAWIVPIGAALSEGVDIESGAALDAGVYSLVVSGVSEGTITTAVKLARAKPASDAGCTTTTRASGWPIAMALLLGVHGLRRRAS